MESVLRPTSLTVRYVPLYEGLATAPLRFASLWLAQKAVIRGIGAVSGPRGLPRRVLFFMGGSLYEGGLPAFQHPLLSYPLRRGALCSQIRLTACTLGICHPRFLCSGAKQTRNSLSPSRPFISAPATANTVFSTLFPSGNAPVSPFPFLLATLGLLHALLSSCAT